MKKYLGLLLLGSMLQVAHADAGCKNSCKKQKQEKAVHGCKKNKKNKADKKSHKKNRDESSSSTNG